LQCTVFSEEISSAQDVTGWRILNFEDYNALVKRVEDSKEEVTRENEELDPDELVPVSFQGEMRPPPDGLLAILLPFQVEGVSWMYHQEVNDNSCVRGGMLCDEVRQST
jgi:SNF2 family DNA or RNA helicase